jgi:hypothetical protein
MNNKKIPYQEESLVEYAERKADELKGIVDDLIELLKIIDNYEKGLKNDAAN